MPDILTAQFVSAPESSATLRYDFFVKTATYRAHILHGDGFDLGVPAWSGEPEGVGGTYGYRQMRFTQRVEGTKAVAMGRLSALAKEMLRSTNWLKVQLATSLTPVYFKIFRGDPGVLSLEYVEASQAWDITVPLVADAFAYGARVSIATATLGNSLSATNPLRLVLPTIKGDAPAPLRIKVGLAGSTNYPGDWLNAVVSASSGTVTDTVIDIGTGDIWTALSGTSAPVTDSAYLGGSYRTVTVSAVTPPASNVIDRISGTFAAAPPRGRYKVVLRCEADPINSTTPNRYSFVFGQVVNQVSKYGQTVTLDTPPQVPLGTTSAFQGWVDLGDFTFPFGGTAIPEDITNSNAPVGVLKIGTVTGVAGTVRIDALKLIPLDGPTIKQATLLKTRLWAGFVDTNLPLTSTTTGTWDGDSETMWGTVVASGAIMDGNPPQAGGYPVADPGAAQNVLLCFPTSRGPQSGSITQESATWTVDVSYHPHLLHFGDGT